VHPFLLPNLPALVYFSPIGSGWCPNFEDIYEACLLDFLMLLRQEKPFLAIISGGILSFHSCYQLGHPFSSWVNYLQESFYIVNPGL
jgi:hypothetical protein